MLTAADLDRMKQDIADLIRDHAVTIQLRRGGSMAVGGEHTVRIERKGSFTVNKGGETEQTVTRYVVVSSEAIDIRAGDRFNAFGFLFEVAAVSPKQVGTQADTYMVQ